MSHVDDGTLHAYLDGELTPVEQERTDSHLAGCQACRARLEEERSLIERAGRLLSLAAPAERPAPPLHELRRPRLGGVARFRLPLTWAATLALAIGIGWYARGFRSVPGGPAAPDRGAVASTEVRPAHADEPQDHVSATPPPHGRLDMRRNQSPVPPATRPAPAASEPAGREVAAQPQGSMAPPAPTPAPAAKAVARLSVDSGRPGLRGAAAPVVIDGSIVLTQPNALQDAARPELTTTWPVIEPRRARDLLGEDPAVIPGYPVHTLRSNPGAPSQVLVEQLVDSGIVLLFERRSDPAVRDARVQIRGAQRAAESNERLARYVRSLRIEIVGAVSADSLSKLLGLIR
jgi:putative zinc finger protein